MAKDPAFLFYSDNFQSGTQFFTDEQTGKYIRLLCAQHLHGHLPEKHMIHICKTYDVEIFAKFKKDADGNFYNERLESEILRRRNYSESRSTNRKSVNKKQKKSKNISKSYVNHMGNGIGNENGNTNEAKNELVFPFDSQNFLKHWQIWKSYKKDQHRFTYKTPISEQAALNDLVNLAEGREDRAIEIIMQSISKSWKGFFELKTNLNGKQQPGTLREQVQADSERRRKEREQART